MSNFALWHHDKNRSELRKVDPQTTPGLARIHSLYSLISIGTERAVASGMVDSELQENMAVPYMQGSFSLPVKYGYSLVGRTDEGQLVHVLHPHQQIAFVHQSAIFPLSEDISPRRMTLLSNMETIINAIWDAEHWQGLNKNSRIAICGFGTIGSLLAMTLKIGYELKPVIIETDEWNKNKAISLGFNVLDSLGSNLEFDLFFNTSCSQQGLQWCIDNAAMEAVIVEMSWYAGKSMSLQLDRRFHFNRVRIISSQVSNIPKHKQNEDFYTRKKLAQSLLTDEHYDELFEQDIVFSEAPEFFNQLRRSKPEGLVWCIKYRDEERCTALK